MKLNIWNLSIYALVMVVAQGCNGPGDNGTGAPGQANDTSGLNAGPTQSAVLLSNVTFKYGNMALNQRQLLDDSLRADEGCSIAAEYSSVTSRPDLANSVAAYCGFLVAQNVAVLDCAKAQGIALDLARQVSLMSSYCAGRAASRIDPITLTLTIVGEGKFYRRELGLPTPELLRQ